MVISPVVPHILLSDRIYLGLVSSESLGGWCPDWHLSHGRGGRSVVRDVMDRDRTSSAPHLHILGSDSDFEAEAWDPSPHPLPGYVDQYWTRDKGFC